MSESKIVRKIRRRNHAAKQEMIDAQKGATVCAAHASVTHSSASTMDNQEDIAEAIIESRNGAASISFGAFKITTNNAKDLIGVLQFAVIIYGALVLFGIVPSPKKIAHKHMEETKPPITEVAVME